MLYKNDAVQACSFEDIRSYFPRWKLIANNSAVPSFSQTLRELLQPIEALFDVWHTGRVTDSQIVVRTECDARHGRDFFLLEQFRAEIRGFQAELRDVREEVERPLGIDATDARDRVQALMRVAAPL